MGAPAPGWMLDPEDSSLERWWDGSDLTELRRPLAGSGSRRRLGVRKILVSTFLVIVPLLAGAWLVWAWLGLREAEAAVDSLTVELEQLQADHSALNVGESSASEASDG